MAKRAKRRRKSRPTKGRTNRKNKIKKRYSSAREEAQLADVIPVSPDGAVRDERVPASVQEEQPLSDLIEEAIRKGWDVPEERKPFYVDELAGIIEDPDRSARDKIAAFNALRMADKDQYERDNPDKVARAKGGTQVAVVNNVQLGDVFDDIERDMQVVMERRKETQNLQEDSAPQSVDAAQADEAQREPETD